MQMWYEEGEPPPHLSSWPESQRLKVAMKDKKRGMKYTMPGLRVDLSGYIDSSLVKGPSFSHVDPSSNVQSLSGLIKNGKLTEAVEACGKILTSLGQGHDMAGKPSELTPYVLYIWSIRLQLLLAIRNYSGAIDEISSFEDLDAPDLFLQYYPANTQQGSMVPFSMRLLHAEILCHSPAVIEALPRIQRLKSDIEKVLISLHDSRAPTDHIRDWKERAHSADKLYAQILFVIGEKIHAASHFEKILPSLDSVEEKTEIGLAISRIALESIDVKRAEETSEASGADESRKEMYRGIREIFDGELEKGRERMEVAAANNASMPLANNLAVSRLYGGDPKAAAEGLLKAVRQVKASTTLLDPLVMQNLRAIIEVLYSTADKKTIYDEIGQIV